MSTACKGRRAWKRCKVLGRAHGDASEDSDRSRIEMPIVSLNGLSFFSHDTTGFDANLPIGGNYQSNLEPNSPPGSAGVRTADSSSCPARRPRAHPWGCPPQKPRRAPVHKSILCKALAAPVPEALPPRRDRRVVTYPSPRARLGVPRGGEVGCDRRKGSIRSPISHSLASVACSAIGARMGC